MDEQVIFYVKTFGGTVFVTKDGEIVYALPMNCLELRVQGSECKGRIAFAQWNFSCKKRRLRRERSVER